MLNMSVPMIELNKLRITELNLSKSISTLFEHLKQRENENFFEILQENENARNIEAKKTHEKLRNTYIFLNKIKLVLIEKTQNLDLKQIKQDMIAIQKEIQNTKEQLRTKLHELQKEETELTTKITAQESRLQEWNNYAITLKDVEQHVYKKSNVSSTNNICKEAADFLKFVSKSGGHENGWSTEDHRLFLKIKNCSKSPNQLAKALHKLLPDISEEEIIKHVKWYQQYTDLLEKRREAIKEWKNNKRNRENTAKSVTSSAQSNAVKSQVSDTQDIREKVLQWKIEKEKATRQQNEMNLEEKTKQINLQKYRRMKNEAIKKEINEWKQNRTSILEAEKKAIEKAKLQKKETRQRQANKLIKEFQKQDNLYINRKREFAKMSPKSTETLIPKIIAARDPERLLKPTKQWLLRTHSLPTKTTGNIICSLQQIEKLKYPDWRKGLH